MTPKKKTHASPKKKVLTIRNTSQKPTRKKSDVVFLSSEHLKLRKQTSTPKINKRKLIQRIEISKQTIENFYRIMVLKQDVPNNLSFNVPITKGKWTYHEIAIDGIAREVRSRPRIFDYVKWRTSVDPAWADEYWDEVQRFYEEDPAATGTLAEYEERARRWCFEFDIVDRDGFLKTLRVICQWPGVPLLSFAEMERYKNKCPQGYKERYPEGIISFIESLFPISVDLENSKIGFIAHGGSPEMHDAEVKFVIYESAPYGMLDGDKALLLELQRKQEATIAPHDTEPFSSSSTSTDEMQDLWPGGPVKIHKDGESIIYLDKIYEVGRSKVVWVVIRALVAAKGARIKLNVKSWQSYFKKPDAHSFWRDAISDHKKAGRGGDKESQIYTTKR